MKILMRKWQNKSSNILNIGKIIIIRLNLNIGEGYNRLCRGISRKGGIGGSECDNLLFLCVLSGSLGHVRLVFDCMRWLIRWDKVNVLAKKVWSE